jgi:Glucose-6-phosphate dehydrogenase, C-terminal domain
VNLPSDRVDSLIGSATGGPFDARHRRHMKQWLTVAADDEETWVALGRVDVPFDAELGRPAGPSEHLLHDALSGDRSLFTREDAVEATWWVFRSLVDTGTCALPVRGRRDRRAPPTSFEALHPGLCRGFRCGELGGITMRPTQQSEPRTR